VLLCVASPDQIVALNQQILDSDTEKNTHLSRVEELSDSLEIKQAAVASTAGK
jgi:hypothetical protein